MNLAALRWWKGMVVGWGWVKIRRKSCFFLPRIARLFFSINQDARARARRAGGRGAGARRLAIGLYGYLANLAKLAKVAEGSAEGSELGFFFLYRLRWPRD